MNESKPVSSRVCKSPSEAGKSFSQHSPAYIHAPSVLRAMFHSLWLHSLSLPSHKYISVPELFLSLAVSVVSSSSSSHLSHFLCSSSSHFQYNPHVISSSVPHPSVFPTPVIHSPIHSPPSPSHFSHPVPTSTEELCCQLRLLPNSPQPEIRGERR